MATKFWLRSRLGPTLAGPLLSSMQGPWLHAYESHVSENKRISEPSAVGRPPA
jgi:hypothetical protein